MSRSKKGESKEKKEEFVGTLRMVHKEMDEEMEEHAITAASQVRRLSGAPFCLITRRWS